MAQTRKKQTTFEEELQFPPPQVQEGLEPAWANAVCGPWQRAVSLLALLEDKAVEPPVQARDAALWTCSTQGRRAQAGHGRMGGAWVKQTVRPSP